MSDEILTNEIQQIIIDTAEKTSARLMAQFKTEMDERLSSMATKDEIALVNNRLRDIEGQQDKLGRQYDAIPAFMEMMQTMISGLSGKLGGIEKLVESIRDSTRDGIKSRDDSIRETREDLSNLERKVDSNQRDVLEKVDANSNIIKDSDSRSQRITDALFGNEQTVSMALIPMVRSHNELFVTLPSILSQVKAINEREEARIKARQEMIQNIKSAVVDGAKNITTGQVIKATFGGTIIAALIEFGKAILGG